MWYETFDTTLPAFQPSLGKVYYDYNYDTSDTDRVWRSDGNPTRIITEIPAGGGSQQSMTGGGGTSALIGGGNACSTGMTKYTAIRLGYAINGRAVTFVHDESWCALPGQTGGQCSAAPANKYAVAWAREFRYDGARARYMDRRVDTATFAPHPTLPTVWTDFDGDSAYGDFIAERFNANCPHYKGEFARVITFIEACRAKETVTRPRNA